MYSLQELQFNFSKFVFDQSQYYANKVAYIDDDQTLTYGVLENRSRGFAKSLLDIGFNNRDKLVICMTDSINYPIAFLGCILAGVIPVLVNPRASTQYIHKCILSVGAKAVLVNESSAKIVHNIITHNKIAPRLLIDSTLFDSMSGYSDFDPPTTDASAPAYCLFTSGVTGEPKEVTHSHLSLLAVGTNYGKLTDELQFDDIVYATAKLFFAYGICHSIASPLVAGATAILSSKLPTVRSIMHIIKKHTPSVFVTVPTVYAMLLNSDTTLEQLPMKQCTSAGESLPLGIHQRWLERTGIPLYDLYGCTEFSGCVIANTKKESRIGTVGKPTANYECELRDSNGNTVPDGVVGDLYIKGPSCAMYYSTGPLTKDDWFFTGDKFMKDADGFFVYKGRSNDMLRVAGQWVSPLEIEDVLTQHPDVQEAGVVGNVTSNGLVEIVAHIVLTTDCKTENVDHQLKSYLRRSLDLHKCPKIICIKKELPRNVNGKLQRFLLKDTQ